MKELFLDSSIKSSRSFTNTYSTSFSLGIRMLDKELHDPIYAIYGFVRVADEIVDTFHSQDKEKLIREFSDHTFESIKAGFSSNPILHSFQWVVNEFDIDHSYIEAFFNSMIMDLTKKSYDRKEYEEYIYGSAEVVGLMCLRVFCHPTPGLFDKLVEEARALGSAFQKINFLRDLKADYYEKGRMYFPSIGIDDFNEEKKKEIEKELREEFEVALRGIRKLPRSCKFGVYTAYLYYTELLRKISTKSAIEVKESRIRVSDPKKYLLLINSFLRFKLGLI